MRFLVPPTKSSTALNTSLPAPAGPGLLRITTIWTKTTGFQAVDILGVLELYPIKEMIYMFGGGGLLQGEQLPPTPPTLEQKPHFLLQLQLLPCRHLMVQLLLSLPGLPVRLSFPVMTLSCHVTQTWPPLLWWLQLVRGCHHSMEVENSELK